MKLINIFGFPHFPQIADKEGNTRLISESTPDLSSRNIDENYNAEALSTTSGSSIEPRSDSSLTDNELVLNVGSNLFKVLSIYYNEFPLCSCSLAKPIHIRVYSWTWNVNRF